ncbi:hypothetical protein P692DRAFT_20456772 [Suillus brevipes Sb2]|nr:hypothetical protein P692DRAFT_20456772 [Suillus brevipes Sb2]
MRFCFVLAVVTALTALIPAADAHCPFLCFTNGMCDTCGDEHNCIFFTCSNGNP